MKAYREADASSGVTIMTLAQFTALAPARRSSDVLYIVGDITASTDSAPATIIPTQVWVGNTRQLFLTDNTLNADGVTEEPALVWVDASITGFTNAEIRLDKLI